ncbi:MAG: threonine--tRNA ligase, partial [Ignavibacteria bacterium]|nr:threonine--tRNA ligase [Ignavibacteria bacterium]
MNKIKIGFPDGSIQEYDEGISALEIAKSISKKFSEAVLIAEYNGKPIDLDTKLTEDGNILFHKFDSDKGKSAYWHSTSHLMAQAIEELFPGVKFGVGPAIESGFYYDVDLDRKLTDDDLKAIEEKMAEISKRDLKPVREEMPREKAIEFFRTKRKDLYKVEILEDIAKDDKVVSVYHQGNFSDLCKGPHISSTSKIKSVKLLSVSGSYWRGDENRKMLQRVYGISFPTQKELDEYLKQLEEAKKRDHRKIGKELELFFFNEVSPGAPFWMPNGMVIFKELEKFWRYIHEESGYQEIGTPIVVRESLFRKSGHLEHYREHMYKVVTGDEDNFYLKPMNCPEATLIYSYKLRSYKDLPIRLSEIGRLHRYELSGALGGMFRVRQITMDDAHIFCREDQMLEEITGVLKLIKTFYAPFNFKSSYYLSTRPDKAMGEPELWIQAEASLEQALKKNELKYKVNAKDGAFYGPKIDIHIKDALNRTWQVATVQLDFQMPERLDLTYE